MHNVAGVLDRTPQQRPPAIPGHYHRANVADRVDIVFRDGRRHFLRGMLATQRS